LPVLLMSRGDAQAKDLLRRVIEARYGYQPPVIETLRITMRGRAPAQIGPFTINAGLDITASFRFPSALRFDFVGRAFGISFRRNSVAFDGTTVYRTNSVRPDSQISDTEIYRAFLWGAASFFLTPLGEHFVELNSTGEHSFDAKNIQTGSVAHLQLHSDKHLDTIQVMSVVNGQSRPFALQLDRERMLVNDLALPTHVTVSWNGTNYRFMPIAAEVNPQLSDRLFTLQQ
jgi:hypothetical protein